jgi:hypothetical protein
VPQVTLRIDDFERGDVPAVCAITGVPCANPVGVRLRIGVRPVHGVLPIVPSRVSLYRWLVRGSFFVLVAALAAVFFSFGLAAVLVIAYAGLFFVGNRLWIGSKPADTREEIVVTRVHRNFADAVSR